MSAVSWEVVDAKGVAYVHLPVSSHGLRSFLMSGLKSRFAGVSVGCCGAGDRLEVFVSYSDPS